MTTNLKISELALEELFPTTLTDTKSVNIEKGREVWVATEMCAHYLESTVDSIVVKDETDKFLGIVGGYDLLDHIRKNPTRNFQHTHCVEEIMFKDVPIVDKKTKFASLMEKWKNTRRAFALIPNESDDYSAISARKMLDVGKRVRTTVYSSSIPKKKIITFKADDSLETILNLMFDNKTRKLLLENSDQFISDRLIVGEISRILKFRHDVENFLEITADQLKLDYVHKITKDITLDHLCSIMDRMDHPFVMYNDITISPWDVCLTLLSEDLKAPLALEYQRVSCPHRDKTLP